MEVEDDRFQVSDHRVRRDQDDECKADRRQINSGE